MKGFGGSLKINGVSGPVQSWKIEKAAIEKSLTNALGIPPQLCTECNFSGSWKAEIRFFRDFFVRLHAPFIQARLPADFHHGREKLAAALAGAEFDFEQRLTDCVVKHGMRVRV